MTSRILSTLALALLTAASAAAQIGFPSCTGQPVLTGDQTGTVNVDAYASFTTYTDTIDTSAGAGCNEIAGLPDSVVCFEPTTPCTVSARFIAPAGPDSTFNVFSGCTETPSSCLDSDLDDGGQMDVEVALGTQLYCFVGSAADSPSASRFEFDNLASCGTLAGGGGGGGGGSALDETYFIPAAARASGAGGSFYLTDLDVNNRGFTPATFKLLWLPRDTNNSSPTESTEFTIGTGVSIRFKDILGQVFGLAEGAVGALAVVSDSPNLMMMSRTFNSSDEGTFGQAIVGIHESDLIRTGQRRRVLFMTENDAFRSNLGLQNGGTTALIVKWQRFRADGSAIDSGQIRLRPLGNTQWNRVFSDVEPVEAAYVDVWTDDSGGTFAVYGSVLDAATSDPTTVPGQ